MKPQHAKDFASFLEPMLHPDPLKRSSARDMLNHRWLSPVNEDVYYSGEETDAINEASSFGGVIQMNGVAPLNEEEFDADTSFISSELEDSSEEIKESEDFYPKEVRFFDKSFKQGYGAYSEGIDINELDNTNTWLDEKHCEFIH